MAMGKTKLIVTLAFILILHALQGQENVKIKKSEFKTGVEIGFKEAWSSLKEADKLYDNGMGTYREARSLYLYANEYNPGNAALNYKIGVCYLFTDDKYKAIDYLLKAFELDEAVSGDINFLLGRAHHLVLEFDDAIRHYNAHKEELRGDELEAYVDVLAKRMEECKFGKELSRNPRRVIIKNLGSSVNSAYDDYNPIFAHQDSMLFFTSRRPFGKSKRNPLDNKFNEDIYGALSSQKGFAEAKRLGKPFSDDNNGSLIGVSTEGSRLLIYRGHQNNGTIQAVDWLPEKGKWTKSKDIQRNLLSKDGESSACMSADGQELFYISRNRDLSTGGKDILYAERNEKGKWGEPRNLGALVNSPYDEEGVFLSANGQLLYFASQGHNSMGGFDIFLSRRLDNGGWSSPENMGYPINTPDDEVFYITDMHGNAGYYSATREGGLGYKDIFKVIYLGSEKELITTTHDQLVAGPGTEKRGFLTPPVLPVLDTSILVSGRVLDTLAGITPVVSKLSFIDLAGLQEDLVVLSNDSGEYQVRLPEPTVFGVEINATGYLYFLDLLDLIGESGDQKIVQDFYLQKIEVGTKVVLDNIYFTTGKAVLRPESFDALDQVLRFLENNPGMKLEISGHTDNTGSLRINERLSRDRAKAVVDYLVSGGVPAEALVYEGYADTQPVAPNDSPEGREKNRRVEFKVLSK